jgi:hypothetical protein
MNNEQTKAEKMKELAAIIDAKLSFFRILKG